PTQQPCSVLRHRLPTEPAGHVRSDRVGIRMAPMVGHLDLVIAEICGRDHRRMAGQSVLTTERCRSRNRYRKEACTSCSEILTGPYFLRRMYVTWVTPVILPSLSMRMYSLLIVLLSSDNVLITTCVSTPLRLFMMRMLFGLMISTAVSAPSWPVTGRNTPSNNVT